jgi:hypothetical protein
MSLRKARSTDRSRRVLAPIEPTTNVAHARPTIAVLMRRASIRSDALIAQTPELLADGVVGTKLYLLAYQH